MNKINKDLVEGENKAPFVIELDPTTVCDLACPGCISGDLLNQKNPLDRGFSKDKIKEITDDIIKSGVSAVILIGGGEPLAHPTTIELIKRLGENDVQIGLTTNGTLMGRYIDIIAKYVSWTRVSMDVATDEMFKNLRPTKTGKSKFNLVVENMKKLANKKRGILGYSFLLRTMADGLIENPAGSNIGVIEHTNVYEIYDAAKLSKEIGCDYFELKPSYDDFHQIVMHSEKDIQIAKTQLEMSRNLEDQNFRVLESVMLRSALKREKVGEQEKKYKKCQSANLRTLITPSGCYVCPYFRGENSKKIGDLRFETLSEMWNGKLRKRVMDKLNPSIDCSNLHCIRHETNQEVDFIIDQFKHKKKIKDKALPRKDYFI
ncbi:radical SAM protein [Candidatus Pelagibacter sp. HIMB1542]|uniref:radical SAM protein n=1 Tax=Candidatus Pelagibacter sp. HIMB1542 TaxID=3413346 RepID=UPI003F87ABFD